MQALPRAYPSQHGARNKLPLLEAVSVHSFKVNLELVQRKSGCDLKGAEK